jgi:hypothetical protein
MQLAIGLLTAGLDLPELKAWAVTALTPHDADGLGNFMAGLHVVSELLLHELHKATGEPPEATLQRPAILAEHRRGTPLRRLERPSCLVRPSGTQHEVSDQPRRQAIAA